MFLLAIGLVMLLLGAIIAVSALWPAPNPSGTRTLTTPLNHGLSVGDTFHLPGEGLCVAIKIPGPHSVVYERQHQLLPPRAPDGEMEETNR